MKASARSTQFERLLYVCLVTMVWHPHSQCHPCCLQVVDFIMQTTLVELDASSVQQDPLIKLPCGHCFTTSTLDGGSKHVAATMQVYRADSCHRPVTDDSSIML
jgi:hypothetical protein